MTARTWTVALEGTGLSELYELLPMTPEVEAAIIAGGVGLLTVVTSLYGARKTSQDTKDGLNKQLIEQRDALNKTLQEQRARTLNERFASAAEQLGSDKPPAVQLAGVYAMAGLADDWEENRQTCIDVLCAYLRLPDKAEHWKIETTSAERPGSRESREIRQTVLRVITAHLRDDARVSWRGRDFDFTGVIFDGGSFGGAQFSGGKVNFNRSQFPRGRMSFSDATFSDCIIDFSDAEFSGGLVDFKNSKFSNCIVDFNDAKFSSGEVYFGFAEFSSGKVRFSTAEFSGGQVGFGWAKFNGGEVSFFGARVADTGMLVFNLAEFSGGEVQFLRTMFSGGQVFFVSAKFLGSSTVSFSGAEFSGSQVDFYDAKFLGGDVDFSNVDDWTHQPTFYWDRPPPGVKLPQ